MAMTPRERIMAVLNDEEPDKTPVLSYSALRSGDSSGWLLPLKDRGMGVVEFVFSYKPTFFSGLLMYPGGDVKETRKDYEEDGIKKWRYTLETPVGTISSLFRIDPNGLLNPSREEPFVKKPEDWRVVNYIFKTQLNNLEPNYDDFQIAEDKWGDSGITLATVEKTPFQRAWVELTDLEGALIAFYDKSDDVLEYLDIQWQLHNRIADIMADSPATVVSIVDHVTDTISPKLYREYVLPYYQLYAKKLEGTGKIFATHMDGRYGSLKKEVAESPIKVCESLTLPPGGDISITELKEIWPGKVFLFNCPPHLNILEEDDVRKGYEAIRDEWGSSKKGMAIENSEDIPLDKVSMVLNTCLDVFEY